MSTRLLDVMLGVVVLVWGGTVYQAQAAPQSPSPVTEPSLAVPLEPEAIAAHKAALQARLEALRQTPLPATEVEATRTVLAQLLAALSSLEEVVQQRATFLARSAAVPQHLRALEVRRQALEAQPVPRLRQVTSELRDQYTAELRAVQTALRDTTTQAEADERRLVAIAREMEPLPARREQLDKDILAERNRAAEPSRALSVEWLTVKRQVLDVAGQALEAEREWLTKRRAVHDAQLSVERLRLQRLEPLLDTINQALGTALQQEQEALRGTEVQLAQQLEHSANPADTLRLLVQQESVAARQATAEYQQQRHRLGEAVRAQEQRNLQEKQTQERLGSLIEKYADSSAVAQRFALEFARLRRQRTRHSKAPITALEGRLRPLTEAMLTLDERLYTFDEHMEDRLSEVTSVLQAQPAGQRETTLAELRQELNTLKAALREQQQELHALLQEVGQLLTLHRESRRLRDEGYRFVLTNIVWLRNAEPLGRLTLRDLGVGLRATGQRLYAFVKTEQGQLRQRLLDTPSLWLLVLIVLPGLLWMAFRAYRGLGATAAAAAGGPAPPAFFHQVASVLLLLLQAAIWPLLLVILIWWRWLLFVDSAVPTDLAPALMRGVLGSAGVLWGLLSAHALVRQQGLAQRAWGLAPELCRFLWRFIMLVGLALLGLLVPQQILLIAPGEGDTATGSMTLARLLFVVLQAVTLLLVGVAGRRHSPLMQRLLERSLQARGLVWRAWPLLMLALLGGLVSLILLQMLGYDYAARFLWSRALASLAVGVGMLGVIRLCDLRLSRWLVQTFRHRAEQELPPRSETRRRTVQRTVGAIRVVWQSFGVLLTAGIVLHMWGLSVAWIATAPTTLDILSRLGVVALTVGLVVLVIQASTTLTDYLLQPRVTLWGEPRAVGRKLRTLAPLVQAIIRVSAIFVAALVLLEQLGVATAPLLTGVGIFGLAVGFASQSLIKDVINGLFLLFEDSLSVGDVVMLRGTGGLVEKVTLRTVTLRDLSGNVHIIPNSTIEMVTNMTMGYSYYLFNVRVAYSVDVDTIIAILQEIDVALRQDPAYAVDILAPLEILGLDSFEASVMVLQARIKTRPIQQWRVGREFQRRMQKTFDARGIVMPLPQMVLSGWVNTPSMGQAHEPQVVSPPSEVVGEGRVS